MRARGFTLLEVLVALFVFAIAITVLVQAGSHRAQNLDYLRERTLATWIASDRLTEIRLDPRGAQTGSRDGELEMVGRTWYWEADVRETPEESVRRIEVSVYPDEDAESLASMSGFLAVPDVVDQGGTQQ